MNMSILNDCALHVVEWDVESDDASASAAWWLIDDNNVDDDDVSLDDVDAVADDDGIEIDDYGDNDDSDHKCSFCNESIIVGDQMKGDSLSYDHDDVRVDNASDTVLFMIRNA